MKTKLGLQKDSLKSFKFSAAFKDQEISRLTKTLQN